MYGKALVTGAVVAGLASIQSCPAPPIAIGVAFGVGVPLAGNLIYIGINDNVKRMPIGASAKFAADPRLVARQSSYPDGLPESAHLAYDQCVDQNGDGRTTTVTRQSENSFQLTGVAPACMTLATYFTDSGTPVPCGNDCLQYSNLSDDDVSKLMGVLSDLGKA